MVHEYIRELLKDNKLLNVQSAYDGDEAKHLIEEAYLKNTPFDFVFLDWNMENTDGIDVLRFFRAQPKYDNMVFVMLTAESERSAVLEAIQAGITAYLVKPVTKATLLKKVHEIYKLMTDRQKLHPPQRS